MSAWLVVLLTLAAVLVAGVVVSAAIDKDAREYLTGFLTSPLVLAGALLIGLMSVATKSTKGPRRARREGVRLMLDSPDSQVTILASSPRGAYLHVRYVPQPDEEQTP